MKVLLSDSVLVANVVGGKVKFTAKAVREGMVFSPSISRDIVRAAAFLEKEAAAVSCRCNGYTVQK